VQHVNLSCVSCVRALALEVTPADCAVAAPPAGEHAEMELKARPLLQAVGATQWRLGR
jgi:hypothetical protein